MRGQHYELVAIIFTVIILVLFFFIGPPLFKKGDSYLDAATCQESIERNIRLRLGGKAFFYGINCPTVYRPFPNSEQAAKKAVADAMVDCWDRWHQGKAEVFPLQSEVFCDVCTVFESDKEQREITGLLPFLAKEKLASGETYFEHLQGTSVIEGATAQSDTYHAKDYLITSHPYAVVFRYNKKAVNDQSINEMTVGDVALMILSPLSALVSRTETAAVAYRLGTGEANAAWFANILLVPFNKDQLQEGFVGCTNFPSQQRR